MRGRNSLNTFSLPQIATGTTGTPVRRAIRPRPAWPFAMVRVLLRVPSGNITRIFPFFNCSSPVRKAWRSPCPRKMVRGYDECAPGLYITQAEHAQMKSYGDDESGNPTQRMIEHRGCIVRLVQVFLRFCGLSRCYRLLRLLRIARLRGVDILPHTGSSR